MDPIPANQFSFDWYYPGAFIWGLLVLTSLIGWGQTVGYWLVRPQRDAPDWGWGLGAAWGMAVFLVLSGPLILVSAFTKTFVGLFLLAGMVMAVWHSRLAWGTWAFALPVNLGLRVLIVVLFLVVGVTYAGAVADQWYNSCDDFAAYFVHSKMLLDTGTFSNPFDSRLLLCLGGQQTLVTLVLAFLPWKYAHLLDNGIALLILLGLILELVRGNNSNAWIARLMLAALALTFFMPSANTASQFTGCVFFLALLRSFDLVATRRSVGWRSALLLAGLIMATATLRGHFVFAVALLGFAFVAWRLWEGEQDRWEISRESLMTLVAAMVLLVPWWIVTYRSSGSFLYPLLKGTQRPEFNQLNPDDLNLSFLFVVEYTGAFFLTNIYLLLYCPVFFAEPGSQRRGLWIMGGALLLISVLFVSQFPHGQNISTYRYLAPFGLAFALYSSGAVVQQFVAKSPFRGSIFSALRATVAIILATLLLLFQSFDFLPQWYGNTFLIHWGLNARHEIAAFGMPLSTDEVRSEYREAFAQIPSGSKTLAALDFPFLLDFQQHSIFTIDFPGGASPDPGMPCFRGAEPIKKYLLTKGIRYIAHVPFDRSEFLYSRETQTQNLSNPVSTYRMYAKYNLDFFNNIDRLAQTNRIIYDSPTIQVIDLGN